MSRGWIGHATALIAVGVTGGCATLPTSGPSLAQVEAGSSNGIRIVDVDKAVAQKLRAHGARKPFSEVFAGATGRNETIGSGDILEVSVWEAPPAVLFLQSMRTPSLPSGSNVATSGVTDFPQQMVDSNGTIYVPFAGMILATGKTIQEIEAEVTQGLQGKANRPQVLVRRMANNTDYVTVVGEVTNSTRMPLTPRGERLLDALAAAGGTRQAVGKISLQLTRGTAVHALPLDAVIRDPRQNVPLQPGDVVTALYQPQSFTALGAMGKSDEINFESQGISLAEALARAGGVNDSRANAAGVFIFRFEPQPVSESGSALIENRTPIVYRINLKDPSTFFVAQQFPIEDKDIIYVANAPAAELQKFLNLLVSTVYPIEGAVSLSK
jgi:polysaccharide export outer membrane protein